MLLLCRMTSAQTKIVVLSDPHVMAPSLLVSEGSAWTEYLAGQRKLVDYSKPLFDEMIARIKDDIQPDLVLITGDLSKDGETVSHEYVVSKLNVLKDAGIKSLVIPGNHDRGSNANAVSYNGSTTTPVPTATNDWFATTYANYGYGASSDREATTLTYACEPVEGLMLIGVDSGTDGTVSATTLDWVCDKAAEAYATGKQVIAMMHHPLFPHFTGVDTFVETATVDNYATVRNRLADAGVKVVFTGHFHTSDIAKDYNADLSKDIYDVNTGSLISYPCDYRVVLLNSDLTQMDITTASITEITPGDGFSTTAKTRLSNSVKAQATAKGISYSLIADPLAQAFVFHAEGDEDESIGAQTLLTTYGPSLPEALKPLANSMLQDLSNYGDVDRQDKTADRILSITMPALTETITMAADGWSTYCTGRRLDLSKTDGVIGYIVSSTATNKVVLQQVSIVPANTGFIVNGTSTSYALHATDKAADDMSSNKLVGTLVATPAPTNTYVLSTQGGKAGFYPVQTGLSIPAHKAYLTVPGGARKLEIDGISTDIQTVTRSTQSGDRYYDLQGHQLMRPMKGVVITKGKSFISK